MYLLGLLLSMNTEQLVFDESVIFDTITIQFLIRGHLELGLLEGELVKWWNRLYSF